MPVLPRRRPPGPRPRFEDYLCGQLFVRLRPQEDSMDLALLVLRLVVGLLFVGHGAQKLFGAFGGGGIAGTAGTGAKKTPLAGRARTPAARPPGIARGGRPPPWVLRPLSPAPPVAGTINAP